MGGNFGDTMGGICKINSLCGTYVGSVDQGLMHALREYHSWP